MKSTLLALAPRAPALVLCLLLGALANVSVAQQLGLQSTEPDAALPELDATLTKEAVREMVSRMSDDAVRAFLIQRLDAVADADADANAVSAWSAIGSGFSTYTSNALVALGGLWRIPTILDITTTDLNAALAPEGFGDLLLRLVLGLICGLVVERVVARLLKRRKQRLIDRVDTTLWGILSTVYTRLVFDILGVAAFAVVSYSIVVSKYGAGTLPGQLGYTVIATLGAGWLAWVVGRFYFAPDRPDLRICKTNDVFARRLNITYAVLAAYIVLMHNVFTLLLLVGLDRFGGWDNFVPLGFTMNISLYIGAAAVLWWNRHGLSDVLLENKRRVYAVIGEEAPVETTWFAANWPFIAVSLVVFKYLLVEIVVNSTDVAVYSTAAVYITFIVVFLWPSIDANVALLVGKGIHYNADETEAAARARRRMQQSLLRVGRVVVVGVVLYALAWLWGVNVLSLAEAGFGAKVAGRLLEALLVALVAYLLLELVSIFCSLWLAAEGGDPDDQPPEPGSGGDGGGVGLSRVATLLPIIKRTAQAMIVVISIMMVLSNWGINIGPILAGAGVVGLAIGFGAQTLVKDIVSGMFFLFDDAFRVGEYIDVNGTMGSVEKISLRSLRLRHHKGLVHTIPYGEIPKLTNYSRDWVIMKLRFRVPFDADINKVKKIFKQIGKEMLEDPMLGDDFLQPFKSQGVADVDDDGIVVRGKFMAKPGTQFMIRKEIYVRVQKAFEENGIPFARKQVMVHIPGLDRDVPLGPEDAQSIGAAAAEIAQSRDRSGGQPAPA
ncbi:MAG: mechanosensitive ion channel family protein [Pseudomonadota bacterium]